MTTLPQKFLKRALSCYTVMAGLLLHALPQPLKLGVGPNGFLPFCAHNTRILC
nr:MAG TPA: hypothetical protein [Caudoviricetes sp.]